MSPAVSLGVPDGHATVVATAANTLCQLIGAGMLSVPLAIHDAGAVIGCFCCVAFGVVAVVATYLITLGCAETRIFVFNDLFAECSIGLYRIWRGGGVSVGSLATPSGSSRDARVAPSTGAESETLMSFEDTAAVNIGACASENDHVARVAVPVPPGPHLYISIAVDALVAAKNFGVLVAYARIITDAAVPITRDLFGAPAGFIVTRTGFWYAAGGVVFFALTCARAFKELRFTSYIGVVTIAFVILTALIKFGEASHDGALHSDQVHAQPPGALSLLRGFSLFSTAYAYHYNAPAYFLELKDRTVQRAMLTVIFLFPLTVAVYLAVGMTGWSMFGDAIASHHAGGNMINNFSNTDTLVNVARLLLAVHLCCSFPVLSVNVRHSVHRLQLVARGHPEAASDAALATNTARAQITLEAALMVGLCITLAIVIPGIGFVFDLTGALVATFIMITHPAVVGAYVFRAHVPRPLLARLCTGMAVLGTVAGVLGVAAAIIHVARGD